LSATKQAELVKTGDPDALLRGAEHGGVAAGAAENGDVNVHH